jgi:STIP1 family protein 1
MAADIGNRLFTEKKYTEAIESYTSALSKNPKDYRSMTNRALCYIKLNEWSSVIEDSQTIIGHDPSSIKAHFYLGQAYMATDDYDKAIDSLQTANTLAKEQRRNFGDDITGAIRLAKKKVMID